MPAPNVTVKGPPALPVTATAPLVFKPVMACRLAKIWAAVVTVNETEAVPAPRPAGAGDAKGGAARDARTEIDGERPAGLPVTSTALAAVKPEFVTPLIAAKLAWIWAAVVVPVKFGSGAVGAVVIEYDVARRPQRDRVRIRRLLENRAQLPSRWPREGAPTRQSDWESHEERSANISGHVAGGQDTQGWNRLQVGQNLGGSRCGSREGQGRGGDAAVGESYRAVLGEINGIRVGLIDLIGTPLLPA